MAKKKAKKAVSKKKSVPAQKKTTSKVPVQPLSDRVLVRREDMPDKKSVAGILLPDNAQKDKSKIGTVLAIGPGRISDDGALVAMSVSVGDKVIFNAGWDNEVAMDDDKEYFLVRESDVLAILNN